MLYALLTPLSDGGDVYNLFRYITFRAGGAMITALLLSLLLGRRCIDWLARLQREGQPIREDGPASHHAKAGTPTMGGLLILGALLVSTLLWARWDMPQVWVVLLAVAGFAAIGFADDLQKLRGGSARGLPMWLRLVMGFALAALVTWLLSRAAPEALAGKLAVPVFKNVLIDSAPLYFLVAMLTITGTANGVNFTDGLDGLAIVPVMIASGTFGFISYLVGNALFADYLQLHFVPGTGELAVYAGALVGAGLGFLWFNAPPAQVFMGDTGALALGGGLGAVAVATMHEFVLAIVGGLFVIEVVSVVIQVASFKMTGRRVFLMSPIHHHFEQKGWKEPTIVIRFWIVAVVLALIGLATLKLR